MLQGGLPFPPEANLTAISVLGFLNRSQMNRKQAVEGSIRANKEARTHSKKKRKSGVKRLATAPEL